MSNFDPDALSLDESDARYLGETEVVRLDARLRRRRVAVDVSAEAVEKLVGEGPLSPERLIDGVEANRAAVARIARDKAGGRTPAGDIVLITARDVPRGGGAEPGRIH